MVAPAIAREDAIDVTVRVACGGAHTLILTEAGKLLACGLNACGQLGDGTHTDVPQATPMAVKLPPSTRVAQIGCGEEFSCALTSEGKLFVWGHGGCGQLGHGATSSLSA